MLPRRRPDHRTDNRRGRGFDVAAGHAVLFEIERRRARKVGCRRGADRFPMHDMAALWRVTRSGHTWTHTVRCRGRTATPSLQPLCNRASNPKSCSGCAASTRYGRRGRNPARRVGRRGFRIRAESLSGLEVQGAGLHRGFRASRRAGCRAEDPVPPSIAPGLRRPPTFVMTLCRGDQVIDRGVGSHVLDSPALAVAHLVRVLRPAAVRGLAAGEIVTTGTLTDAWPVAPGDPRPATTGIDLPGLRLAWRDGPAALNTRLNLYHSLLARPVLGRRLQSIKDPVDMKSIVTAVFATVLSACTWQTNRALLPDDPDDKAVHTGSHIPVKENPPLARRPTRAMRMR